ncbi:MAG: YqgE/AlgH family protein [Deltaproteobacteria bacterium]|nr:YqgE/AlgH family protein [Deltaproteobacteria bacterium]
MTGVNDKLVPGFLVAPPPMGDPNFDHTLVLMALHDDNGSLGFVVNRKSSLSLHTLLKELEIEPLTGDRPVLSGGPVSGTTGFVLYEHAANQPMGSGVEVTPSLSLSPSKDVLTAAARGELKGRFELLLGYAGWGPGQLGTEIQRGSWLYADFDPAILWDVALEQRWEDAYRRLGVSPMAFMHVPGGARA